MNRHPGIIHIPLKSRYLIRNPEGSWRSGHHHKDPICPEHWSWWLSDYQRDGGGFFGLMGVEHSNGSKYSVTQLNTHCIKAPPGKDFALWWWDPLSLFTPQCLEGRIPNLTLVRGKKYNLIVGKLRELMGRWNLPLLSPLIFPLSGSDCVCVEFPEYPWPRAWSDVSPCWR